MDQISEPFFSTIFSLSSHHPYTIPKEYNGKFSQGEIPIHESVSYSDYALKQFFEAAKKRLLPDGKLVVIFSNLSQITEVSKTHPIQEEIEKGGRFHLEKCLTRAVKAASEKTKRDQNWRSSEEVELWILKHQ